MNMTKVNFPDLRTIIIHVYALHKIEKQKLEDLQNNYGRNIHCTKTLLSLSKIKQPTHRGARYTIA